MATNHTARYGLSQWLKTDKVQMEDFNADNAKIDGALGSQADAVTALSADLTKKINGVSSDLTKKINGVSSDLTKKIDGASASQTDVTTALAAELAKKGNCRVEVNTFTDNTTHSSSNPVQLHFTDKPAFFVLFDALTICVGTYGVTYCPTLYPTQYGAGLMSLSGTWSGNTFTATNYNRAFSYGQYYLAAFYVQ